jgi:monoamine oxidase
LSVAAAVLAAGRAAPGGAGRPPGWAGAWAAAAGGCCGADAARVGGFVGARCGQDLAGLSFLISDAAVPTWWTQHPRGHPVLTGWLAGPRADRVSSLSAADLIEMGLASLAEIFDLPPDRIGRDLVASRAIDWGNDPFARGAYSYATPQTRAAQSALREPDRGSIFFAGEAFYAGAEMGTVEAALASGLDTARTMLAAGR